MPRGKRAGSKMPTADYDAGCPVKSTSTKCPTRKSRTSSSPPISRPENAWASRPLFRQSSKSLAKTCKSGLLSPVALGARIQARASANGVAMSISAKLFALISIVCLTGVQAMTADGLVTVRSSHDPKETMSRLEAEVKAKGLTVFAHVDHAAGAAEVGLPLRASDLLIFGNAKGGSPLMQLDQTMGIDLPLKALIWQDQAGVTWLSYNDPGWL